MSGCAIGCVVADVERECDACGTPCRGDVVLLTERATGKRSELFSPGAHLAPCGLTCCMSDPLEHQPKHVHQDGCALCARLITKEETVGEKRPEVKPGNCRSCNAPVWFARWKEGAERMAPVNVDPVPTGNVVLGKSPVTGELRIEHYDPKKHDAQRKRYVVHFATCPNAVLHRKPKEPGP